MLVARLIIIATFTLLNNIAHGANVTDHISFFIKTMENKTTQSQGGAFAVIHNGNIIYKKTFGYRKLATGVITDETLFSVGSVSKAITSLAIAKLVDENKLSFSELFPIPELSKEFSLKQVLGHTTGYHIRGDYEIEKGLNKAQILNFLASQKQKCQNCYFYSNVIFSLVEEMLQQKNMSLEEALSNLNINGMKLYPVSSSDNIAYRHARKNTTKPLFHSNYFTSTPSAAGIYINLSGMIEILHLSTGNQNSISPATLNELYTPQQEAKDIFDWKIKFPPGIKSYYAIGWRVIEYTSHHKLIFHSGRLKGCYAFIGFSPSAKTGVIFMANTGSGQGIVQEIFNFFADISKQTDSSYNSSAP